MYFNRWVVFSASCLMMLAAGLNYTFSLFAPAIQKAFDLNEVSLSTVATCGFNLGGYLAIISGVTYANVAERHDHIGPRLVIWIGCSLFLGYYVIWCMVHGSIPYSYGLLMAAAIAAGNAGTWLDCSAMSTCLRNFPTDRGSVVGVLKAFLALAGSLLSLIFTIFFTGDPESFILFLALGPPLFALCLSLFINRVPDELTDGKEKKETNSRRFAQVYAVIALLALSACLTALLGAWHEIEDGGRKVAMTLLLIILSSLLLVPLTAGPITFPRRRSMSTPSARHRNEAGEEEEEESLLSSSTNPQGGDLSLDADWTMRAAITTCSFWLIALQMGIGIGTGLALINNLAGLVRSLGGNETGSSSSSSTLVGACVSLFSVANAAGRLLFGYASEVAMQRGSPRTLVLLLVSILSFTFSLLMTTVVSTRDLILLSFIGGLAFGGHWSIIPSTLSDIYGLKIFPTLYTLVQLAPALGGYLLATLIIGLLGYGSSSWGLILILNLFSLSGCWILFLSTQETYARLAR